MIGSHCLRRALCFTAQPGPETDRSIGAARQTVA